jgi:hypothetical protein
MTTLVLTILLSTATMLSIVWSISSYRRHRLNLRISRELKKIIDATDQNISKAKAAIQESQDTIEKHQTNQTAAGISTTGPEFMESPELMATVITVLIAKFGDQRLNINDFMIPDEAAVSVYVDVETEEIILSLDPNLSLEASYASALAKTDDTTYH